MSELRTTKRYRVFKGGKIVFNSVDCAVRNVSATGACLMVANAITIPAEFELLLDGDLQPCEVIWRRPDRVGVRFPRTTRNSADAPPGKAKADVI
jgi:PilZ domain